jgi:alpha-1,2-mannosyltransferase
LLLRVAVIVAGLVAVKSFVIDPLTGHFSGTFEDFSAYMGAARSMAAGGSPYAQFDPSTVVMSGFIYPPFAAVLVRPLALLSDQAALTIWLIVSLVCTVAAAVIAARAALPAAWPRAELGVLAAVAFAPATYNYWHGQINPLIFLLLALAYRAYTRDREIATGVLLGLAAGIKVAPLVLGLLLLRRHWWRGTAAMLATGGLTVVIALATLGVGATQTFLSSVFPNLNRATGWIYDQSLGGAVSRLGDQSVLHVQPTAALVEAGSLVAGLAILALAAWATRPGERIASERGAEFGLGVTAMILAGAIAWFPHFTHLLIPIFAAFGLAAARGWHRERGLLLAAASTLFMFGVVAPAAIAQLSISGIATISQTGAWWPFLQLCSVPCITAVWLAVALARSLRAGRDLPEAGTRSEPRLHDQAGVPVNVVAGWTGSGTGARGC